VYGPDTARPTATVGRVATPVADAPATPTHPDRAGNEFRPDIEGLRALAVLAVVAAHARLLGAAGGYVGVDVFYVISGFVITRMLLRDVDSYGRIRIAAFYGRRVLRLVPAASVVVAACLATAVLLLPRLRWHGVGVDAIASMTGWVNDRLATQGVDYLLADAAPSPLQHFWSLAVETQFYLFWPLLLAVLARPVLARAAATVGARTRPGSVAPTPARLRPALGIGAVVVASFGVSVWQTGRSAPWAYFGTQTRVWEFAVGAGLAFAAGWLRRVPRMLAAWAGLIGIGAILVAVYRFDDTTAYPGSVAALPVLGAGLAIAAGCARPASLLCLAPMRTLGAWSYSWYLWHWPALIFLGGLWGGGLGARLTIVAVSLALAALTHEFVENPVRRARLLRARTWRGLAAGAAMAAATASVAALVIALPATVALGRESAVNTATALKSIPAPQLQLAQLLAGSAVATSLPANLHPTPDHAVADSARFYRDHCDPGLTGPMPTHVCMYGDPASSTVAVLFGDSHAGQWFPALDLIAMTNHWRLAVLSRSSCSAASVSVYLWQLKRAYTECDHWRVWALAQITALHPDLVVVSSDNAGQAANGGGDRTWALGWQSTLRSLRGSGARVAVVGDTAWAKVDVPECVAEHPRNIGLCANDRTSALVLPGRRAAMRAAAAMNRMAFIDPVPWMCTATICPVVVGDTLVYRDTTHLTASFATALAPLLAAALPEL
jgi:peptidoglycan/LPS O-acetylase OafA/YrhL